ncbi:MAG: NAD-dependent epimerase/dehydratase family protein [Deltaproteobacteria bacterium]|nr:NAD-dependent epimerase/dehydratase family protein [Deltaproteobacteria bacterium]
MLEGATILITGGAGFIGTSLARRLVDKNRVVVLDILHRDALSDTDLAAHDNLELIKGDVRDSAAVREAMDGATHVVHLASIAGVDTVIGRPFETMEVAIKGTFNVLEAARELPGLERLVDLSTSEVFGRYAFRATEGDVTSLGAVGEARWTYAVSKLATEHLCHVMHAQYGLPAVSVRPFNIFGPGQVGTGAIHHFIVRALLGEELTVHNEGDQIRAWCYIDDMVDGLLLTLSRPEAVGRVFNIGNPRTAITVYNLATLIVRLSGSGSPVVNREWPHPDVELRVPDISRARDLLGYRPQVDLEEGILRTIEWYRENPRGGAPPAEGG